MEIYKITKGNFCLDKTRDSRPHENNLRFHIKLNEKYYEYAIDTINKSTINIRCVVGKTKNSQKCYARATLLIGPLSVVKRRKYVTERFEIYFMNYVIYMITCRKLKRKINY